MRTRRIAAFGLLTLAALAVAALAVAVIADDGSGTPQTTTAAPLHPVAGNFEPDETKLEDCSDDDCPASSRPTGTSPTARARQPP